jgi:hypothetical protein
MLLILWLKLMREYKFAALPWYIRFIPWALIGYHLVQRKRIAAQTPAATTYGESPAYAVGAIGL